MTKLITPVQTEAAIKQLADLTRDIKSQYSMTCDRIAELDKEQNNILHRMERHDCLYQERGRLATRLRQVRAERRRLKDWRYSVKQMMAYMESDKGDKLCKALPDFLGVARKCREAEERKTISAEVEL